MTRRGGFANVLAGKIKKGKLLELGSRAGLHTHAIQPRILPNVASQGGALPPIPRPLPQDPFFSSLAPGDMPQAVGQPPHPMHFHHPTLDHNLRSEVGGSHSALYHHSPHPGQPQGSGQVHNSPVQSGQMQSSQLLGSGHFQSGHLPSSLVQGSPMSGGQAQSNHPHSVHQQSTYSPSGHMHASPMPVNQSHSSSPLQSSHMSEQPQRHPAISALRNELYNVNDALTILCSVAKVQQSNSPGAAVQPLASTHALPPHSAPHAPPYSAPHNSPYGAPPHGYPFNQAHFARVPDSLISDRAITQSTSNSGGNHVSNSDSTNTGSTGINNNNGNSNNDTNGNSNSIKNDRESNGSSNGGARNIVHNVGAATADPQGRDEVPFMKSEPFDDKAAILSAAALGGADTQGPPPASAARCLELLPFESTQLVQEGILTSMQTSQLLDFFFYKMGPFFPFFDKEFKQYATLARHEVLLETICAVAARYAKQKPSLHSIRALRHHSKMLVYQKVFGSNSNSGPHERMLEVRAVVLAILLNLDWPFDDDISLEAYNQTAFTRLSMACGLAKVTGFIDKDKDLFVALHGTDLIVSCRMGLRSNMGMPESSPEMAQKLSTHEKARMGVTRLLAMASRTLFVSRDTTREVAANGSFLSMLDLIHPHFETWARENSEVTTATGWKSASVMFEYNHCRLYVYSLALASQNQQLKTDRSPCQIRMEALKFIYIAIEAATFIIDFELNEDYPANIYTTPSMKWIVRLIHATVFLAKTLLLPTFLLTAEKKLSVYGHVCKATDAMRRAGSDNFQIMAHYVEMMGNFRDQMSQELTSQNISHSDGNESSDDRRKSSMEFGQPSQPSQPIDGQEGIPQRNSGETLNNDTEAAAAADGRESPFLTPMSLPGRSQSLSPSSQDAFLLGQAQPHWDFLDNFDMMVDVDSTMLFMPNLQSN